MNYNLECSKKVRIFNSEYLKGLLEAFRIIEPIINTEALFSKDFVSG